MMKKEDLQTLAKTSPDRLVTLLAQLTAEIIELKEIMKAKK